MNNRNSICEKLNIADISDGIVTSFDLKYSKCFEITGKDYEMLSDQDIQKWNEQAKGFLNNLPDGVTVQILNSIRYGKSCLVEKLEQKIGHHSDEKLSFLANDYLNQLKRRPQREHTIYLFVTYDSKFKDKPSYIFPKLFNSIDRDAITKNRAKALLILKEFEDATLPLLGLATKPLDCQEAFQLMVELLNRSKSQSLNMVATQADKGSPSFYKKYPYLKHITVRDQLIRTAIDNRNPNIIESDGVYLTTLNMVALPQTISDDLINLLSKFEFSFDLSFQITKPNESDFISQLNLIRTICGSNRVLKLNQNDDIAEDQQLYQIEQTKNLLKLDIETAFEIRLVFVVYDHSPEGCIKKSRTIENACASSDGFQVIQDNFCHLNNLVSVLPGCFQLNQRKSALLSSDLSRFLPFAQKWKGTTDLQFLLEDSSHQLLPLSYKTEQPGVSVPNSLVAGTPGEGKSFFTNWLIAKLVTYNPKTFINVIDNGGSYKKLYSIFKDRAIYLEIDYKDECAFDFFSMKSIVRSDETTYGRYIQYMSNLLSLTVQDEGASAYSEAEKYVLETGLHKLYDSISDDDIPLLEDYQKIVGEIEPRDGEDEIFIARLVKNLDIYTDPKSPKSKIFNRRSTIQFDKQMLFIDIQNIDQDPKFQAIFNFMINQNIRDRMVHYPDWKQINIWDEVWKAFKVAKSKDLMEEAGRKGRKNDTSIMLVSQFVSDFLDESIAPIRNACPIHYIFKTTDLDRLTGPEFKYNQNQLRAIESMRGEKGKSSQFFLKWGPHATVAHLEGSRVDAELCSTDTETFKKYAAIYENGNADMFDMIQAMERETCAV